MVINSTNINIWYSRACHSHQDFHDRGLLLTRKLLNQEILMVTVKSSHQMFYVSYHDLTVSQWPWIFCTCPKHFLVLSSFMNYHWVCNLSKVNRYILHMYIVMKRKIKQWWSSIPPISTVPLLSIFRIHVYRGSQLYRYRKLEYFEKTTNIPKITEKLPFINFYWILSLQTKELNSQLQSGDRNWLWYKSNYHTCWQTIIV
jgi:hypothetical protein